MTHLARTPALPSIHACTEAATATVTALLLAVAASIAGSVGTAVAAATSQKLPPHSSNVIAITFRLGRAVAVPLPIRVIAVAGPLMINASNLVQVKTIAPVPLMTKVANQIVMVTNEIIYQIEW